MKQHSPCNGLYILGFGGHARAVADVALAAGWTRMEFIDVNAQRGEQFASFPAAQSIVGKPKSDWQAFPAAGNNQRRRAQVESASIPLATILAPTARIGTIARLGDGTLVCHGAHIGPAAHVGRGVILNTQSVVEHEVEIGDFAHISVNAVVAGRSKIGRGVFIGAGAVVIDSISICDDVTIGAGAVVTKDIESPGVYAGIPAKRLR